MILSEPPMTLHKIYVFSEVFVVSTINPGSYYEEGSIPLIRASNIKQNYSCYDLVYRYIICISYKKHMKGNDSHTNYSNYISDDSYHIIQFRLHVPIIIHN